MSGNNNVVGDSEIPMNLLGDSDPIQLSLDDANLEFGASKPHSAAANTSTDTAAIRHEEPSSSSQPLPPSFSSPFPPTNKPGDDLIGNSTAPGYNPIASADAVSGGGLNSTMGPMASMAYGSGAGLSSADFGGRMSPQQQQPRQQPLSSSSSSSAAPGDSSAHPKPDPSTLSAFSLAYYQSFFDVSTKDIRDRLLQSLNPLGEPFFANETMRPDLYGPFWIVTTVIFLMAASANFGDYIIYFNKRKGPNDVWYYDFEKVPLAATMFYTSLLLFPVIVWIVLRRLNAGRPLVNIICLYGYSFTPYMPASIICAIPGNVLSWVTVSIAFALSTTFLVRNIYSYFLLSAPVPQSESGEEAERHNRLGLFLILGIIAVHFGIAVAVKLYFFNAKLG